MPSSVAPALFTPLKLGQHTLSHRIVLAPMTRLRGDDNGIVSDKDVLYYQQRATKGGLIIASASSISANAGSFPHISNIYTSEQIEAWKKVTSAVHEKGGVTFLQIVHLGRAAFSAFLPEGQDVVSASDIPIDGLSPFGTPYATPRPLTVDEIKGITEDFAQAAKNAVAAGFDGVEIHGANGFLTDQFINSSSNKRTDHYGGSIENRARFTLEVVDAVAQAIGEERTAIRFSPFNDYQSATDDTPVATWSYITEALEKTHPHLAFLDFIEPRVGLDVDGPTGEKSEESLDPILAHWSGPVISSGNYTYDVQSAYDYAEKGSNKLVSFGRAFIANPDLVERVRNHWKLNPYNRDTFYTNGSEGYTDYPFYKEDK